MGLMSQSSFLPLARVLPVSRSIGGGRRGGFFAFKGCLSYMIGGSLFRKIESEAWGVSGRRVWQASVMSGFWTPAGSEVLRSTSEVLRSTSEVLRSTSEVLQSTAEVFQSTSEVLRSTLEVLRSTFEVLRSTSTVLLSLSLIHI